MFLTKSLGVSLGASGVLLLAGCGGAATAVSSPSATGSATQTGTGNASGGFRVPGVSGVIASHTGSTVTVNSQSGASSTVTWTSGTSIVQQEQAAASGLKNGSCVSARAAGAGFRAGGGRPSEGASGYPTGARPSGAHPSGTHHFGTFAIPSKVTATTVTIEPAAACAATGPSSRGGGFGGFSGTVSKLSSGGFTLTVQARGRIGGSSAQSSSAPASSVPRKVAVTTNSSTTYTRETKGSASSLKAGECLTALGTESGTTLAARQITVSQSVNGTCDSGFGGRAAGGSGASNG